MEESKSEIVIQRAPVFSRRGIIAAGLSAALAAGMIFLGVWGYLTKPQTETFAFSRSTVFASGEEERARGFLSRSLADDRIEVVIVGHTSDAGDSTANRALSEARAKAVADLAEQMGVERSRILATGVGGTDPLPKLQGESDRAHQSRLARVEVSLQRRR